MFIYIPFPSSNPVHGLSFYSALKSQNIYNLLLMQLTAKSCFSAPSSTDYPLKIKSSSRPQSSSLRHLMAWAHYICLKKRSIQNSQLSNTAHLQQTFISLVLKTRLSQGLGQTMEQTLARRKIHQRFQKLQLQAQGEIYFNSLSASIGHLTHTGCDT